MSRVAVLKGGRSLERQVSLRSGARVEDALERLGHEVVAHRRRRRPRRAAARRGARRRVRRPARPRRRGRHRPGAARDPRHPVHRRRACRPACAAPTRSLAKHAMRDAGLPTPDFYSFTETAFKELGAADALRRDRGAARVPDRRQARRPGQRARHQVRPVAGRRPAGARRRVLLLAQGPARAPRRTAASSRSRSSATSRCRSSRPCRATRTSTTSRPATRSGARRSCCPAELGDALTERAQALALDVFRLLGCRGFARVDLMLEEARASSRCSRSTRSPG